MSNFLRIEYPHRAAPRPECKWLNGLCAALPTLSALVQYFVAEPHRMPEQWATGFWLFLIAQYVATCVVAMVVSGRARSPRLRGAAMKFVLGSFWMPVYAFTLLGLVLALCATQP